MNKTRENIELAAENDIQPLVITPSPFGGESLPGFILRTAEKNGYANPMDILRYTGMNENEIRSAHPPLEKLKVLYGNSLDALQTEDSTNLVDKPRKRYLKVMGHHIPSMFTQSKNAGVCIECVKENGFIDCFQELKYAIGCHKHQVRTIKKCPICHTPLTWKRLGLTTCSCGASLADIVPDKITDPSVLALLGFMYAKLMNHSLDNLQLEACGFPRQALEGLSITTLLSMIYRFGQFNENSEQADDIEFNAVKTTAEVLTNWPHNFHQYLMKVHTPKANLNVSGLRGQFNSFYESFFKNIEQEHELEFMREAFIEFGQLHWQKATLHPKLTSEIGLAMGMQQLANQLNVHPNTLRKMIADDVINVEVNDLNATRKLVTLHQQQAFKFDDGKRLNIKQMAQRLGIPTDVIRAYKAGGYFKAKHFAPAPFFHELDVEALCISLMQGLNYKAPFLINKRQVTLEQVMRYKISAELKAMWLNAVSSRQILAVGATSALPSGLVFDETVTKSHIAEFKMQLKSTMSIQEVETKLGVDKATVFALMKQGLLICLSLEGFGLRINQESFNNFNDSMITCKRIASLKNRPLKQILALCKQLQIPIVKIEGAKKTFWIPRSQLCLLGLDHAILYKAAA